MNQFRRANTQIHAPEAANSHELADGPQPVMAPEGQAGTGLGAHVSSQAQTLALPPGARRRGVTKKQNALQKSPVCAQRKKDAASPAAQRSVNAKNAASATVLHARVEPRITPSPVSATAPMPAAAAPSSRPPVAVGEAGTAPAGARPQAPSASATPAAAIKSPLQCWKVLGEAVVGLAHRKAAKPLPCQDAVSASVVVRPVLLLSDGAGSALLSDVGSYTLTQGLQRFLQSIDPLLVPLLDRPAGPAAGEVDALLLTRLVIRQAMGLLQDLSEQHRRDVRDFQGTLVVVIVGLQRLYWLSVGDSSLVVEHAHREDGHIKTRLSALSMLSKGEFANQTVFVGPHLTLADVQVGVEPIVGLSGLALMSDGGAERLVSHDGEHVAQRVSEWLDQLRAGDLQRHRLTQAFYSEGFNQHTTLDDRSIVLAALPWDAVCWPHMEACEPEPDFPVDDRPAVSVVEAAKEAGVPAAEPVPQVQRTAPPSGTVQQAGAQPPQAVSVLEGPIVAVAEHAGGVVPDAEVGTAEAVSADTPAQAGVTGHDAPPEPVEKTAEKS